MDSRLDAISDREWETLARQCGYRASKLAASVNVFRQQLVERPPFSTHLPPLGSPRRPYDTGLPRLLTLKTTVAQDRDDPGRPAARLLRHLRVMTARRHRLRTPEHSPLVHSVPVLDGAARLGPAVLAALPARVLAPGQAPFCGVEDPFPQSRLLVQQLAQLPRFACGFAQFRRLADPSGDKKTCLFPISSTEWKLLAKNFLTRDADGYWSGSSACCGQGIGNLVEQLTIGGIGSQRQEERNHE